MTSIELTIKIDRLWYKHTLIMELIGSYDGKMPKEVEKHLRDKAAEITKDREKLEKRLKEKCLSTEEIKLLRNKDKIIGFVKSVNWMCSKITMPKEHQLEEMATKSKKLIDLLK